jgi:hypothetical protein
MPMQTYRLEVRETDVPGIDVDVYGEDDLIEESTHVAYGDFDVEPPADRETPSPKTEEVTADVTELDLQVQRDEGEFVVRLLGDREDLAVIRVGDEEWTLG